MVEIEQIHKNLIGRCAVFEDGKDGLWGSLWRNQQRFCFIFSYGGGWEHLSVSTEKRTPTWEEMCFFKDIFWLPNELCVQYHPAKSDYVNHHPYCLHIWRPINDKMPTPPIVYV